LTLESTAASCERPATNNAHRRDRRDESGKRGIAGRITLVLAARHPPGWEGPLGHLRLLTSYIISPLPLAMVTSTIATCVSADELKGEAKGLISAWLAEVKPSIPGSVVKRVRF